MTNMRDAAFPLRSGDRIATVAFHRLRTPTKQRERNFTYLKRFLVEQEVPNGEAYLKHLVGVLAQPEAEVALEERIKEANRSMPLRVASSIRKLERGRTLRVAGVIILASAICALATAGLFWERISPLFGNLEYSDNLAAAQVIGVIALLSALYGLVFGKKNA